MMMKSKLLLFILVALMCQLPQVCHAKSNTSDSVFLRVVLKDPDSARREFNKALNSTELTSYIYTVQGLNADEKTNYRKVSTMI